MDDVYTQYTMIYGKVKSGNKLEQLDYGWHSITSGWEAYSDQVKAAITLAAADAMDGVGVRTRTEVQAEVIRRLG